MIAPPPGEVDIALVEQGLRDYVLRVAEGLGCGPDGLYSEVADVSTAYLAVDEQLADRPGRDTALVWDERQGWAVAVEPRAGANLLVVAYHGAPLVPDPAEVVTFAKAVFADPPPSGPDAVPDLSVDSARLAAELVKYLVDRVQ